MLEQKENYWDLLRCPRTKLPLKQIGTEHLVSDSDNPNQQYSYKIVNHVPILVDFDFSVLDEETVVESCATSIIPRPSDKGIQAFIKDLYYRLKQQQLII